MTAAIVATAFAGFSRSYYLRSHFHPEPLTPLLRVHGAIFTSWLVLLTVQTLLVAAGRVRQHRALGVVGAALAAAIIWTGTTTALHIARETWHGPPDLEPLTFLVVPLGDMLLFLILVGAGLILRRRPEAHKRLMILASVGLLPAAIGRLPLDILRGGQPVVYALTDLLMLPCVAFDLFTRGRPHPATLSAAGLLIASQPLRLCLANTAPWLAFATWLVR